MIESISYVEFLMIILNFICNEIISNQINCVSSGPFCTHVLISKDHPLLVAPSWDQIRV